MAASTDIMDYFFIILDSGRMYLLQFNLLLARSFCSFSTALHPKHQRSGRLVSLRLASLQPVRMSHGGAGGLVPPRRCMHQEAVNPSLPSICLRLLFPAKQTTRFPTRVPGPHTAFSVDMLYGRHSQMKTVKTPFLKRCVLCGREEQGLDTAQLSAQNGEEVL